MIIPSSSRRGPRALLFCGFVVLGLVPLAGCGDDPGTKTGLQSSIERADRLEAAGSLEEAAATLAKALDVSLDGALDRAADRGKLRERAASLYHRTGAYKEALAVIEASPSSQAPSVATLFLHGDSLRRLNRPTEAIPVLESLLARSPDHFEGALSLATLRFRGADAESSIELFERYFRLAPENHERRSEARREYGRALRRSRRFQEAADQFMTLLESNPSERENYSELAQTQYRLRLREQGKFVESLYRGLSERAFEEYAEDNLMKSGRVGIARAQAALNESYHRQYASALRLFQSAIAQDARDVRIPIYYADLCIQLRRHADGRAALEKALAQKPKTLSGLEAARARIELAARSPRKAAAACRAALGALRVEGDAGGASRGQASEADVSMDLVEASILLDDLSAARSLLARWPVDGDSTPPSRVSFLRGRLELESGNVDAAASLFALSARSGAGSAPELSSWSLAPLLVRSGPSAVVAQLERLPLHLEQRSVCERLLEHPETNGAQREFTTGRLARLDAFERALRQLDQVLGTKPFSSCAAEHERLGDLLFSVRDPSCWPQYLLAADLDAANARVAKILLNGLKDPSDYFVRLKLLRRLLALEPGADVVLREIAEKYLTLHVKLPEAERLARRHHAIASTQASYELLAKALELRGKSDETKRKEARKIAVEGLARFPKSRKLPAILESLSAQ